MRTKIQFPNLSTPWHIDWRKGWSINGIMDRSVDCSIDWNIDSGVLNGVWTGRDQKDSYPVSGKVSLANTIDGYRHVRISSIRLFNALLGEEKYIYKSRV